MITGISPSFSEGVIARETAGNGTVIAPDKIKSDIRTDPHRLDHKKPANRAGTPEASAAGKAQSRKAKSPAAMQADKAESLSVHVARHVSRGAEEVVPKAIIKQMVPGSSPYKALDRMPGVSFTSTDPFGVDSFGANLYVRGFFMNQLGVTVDGVPLNDQTYQSVSGMSLASAMIPDDMDSMTLSQGAGGVDVASTNTLGGTIRITSADPSNHPGGKVSQSFGSYNSYRTYIRMESGRLNESGTKFYTAYARNDEGKWDGGGNQFLQQVDAKLVQPVNERSRIAAFFNWSDLQQWGYPDLSVGMINHGIWRAPHLYPDYKKAYEIAQKCASDPGYNVPGYSYPGFNGCDAALYDGGQNETNYMGGLNLDFVLTDHLTWHTTLYGHGQKGTYTYTDTETPSPGTGAILSEEAWQNSQERYGVESALRAHWGRHRIEGGIWYENDNQQAGLYNYNQPIPGEGPPLKTIGPYTRYGKAFDEQYNFLWRTNLVQFHFQDVMTLARDLNFSAGFKSMIAQTSGGAHANNPDLTGYDHLPVGRLRATNGFLPHLNLDYHLNDQHEFYIDIAENMRAYEVSAFGVANSAYSVQTQDVFNRLKAQIKPSRAWVYLGGYRFNASYMQLNATVYHATLLHQLSAASIGTLNNPESQVVDFRHISMTGATGGVTVMPLPGLSITNNLSYNKGTYDKNVNVPTPEGSRYLPLKGNKIVNYPSWMYKTSIAYTWKRENGEAIVHFDVNYYGKRYYSYLNDVSVGSYWVANTGASYRFKKLAGVRDVMLSFNVYNLFNNKYIATMGENDNPATGDYQSMERGAVREFFGTISAAF